ncbi:hypothetical protein [Sphingomonas panni]|uniref:hypothetical protein n=1 Tax=Sphingomonas panni TaxID=237612 RepID=UPI001F5B3A9C|nr:hypothetical protein [Sphingomonas panni]
MGDKATDQRERLRKGILGEYLAMDYFDAKKVSYFAIEQNTPTWNQKLASNNLKRPDFIIWDELGNRRLVDVKNYTIHVTSCTISVDHTDVRSLRAHSTALGMDALLAFAFEQRYLFFLKLDSLTPPNTLGQPHSFSVVPGPAELTDGMRPRWLPPAAIVAWDSSMTSGLGLNPLSDPEALFI